MTKNIIKFKDFIENMDFYISEAKNWKIFIYPTDTIYWIWAIWNEESIKKIAEIKHRNRNKMFSVIAPNFEYEWIVNWCQEFWIAVEEMKNQLKKYHWVTRIFSHEKPGIRIIKHDFQKFVEKLWMPFITTSVNISWDVAATKVNLINTKIADNVDYIIDDWICAWKPSVLIDFVDGKVIER
jgi:tRNA A37 threonylcarbamoyladenosine synthetase subunit TsaC/SUA5/YrdC